MNEYKLIKLNNLYKSVNKYGITFKHRNGNL